MFSNRPGINHLASPPSLHIVASKQPSRLRVMCALTSIFHRSSQHFVDTQINPKGFNLVT